MKSREEIIVKRDKLSRSAEVAEYFAKNSESDEDKRQYLHQGCIRREKAKLLDWVLEQRNT